MISGWKAQGDAEISKTEPCWQDYSLRGQPFCWRPSLEKEHDGTGSSDWEPHCEIWIDASGLDSIERWRSGVLCSGEGRSSWTIPEIHEPRSGNSNEDWNTKWQFDGEFFDWSIGSRTANETHWHAVLLDTRTSSRWRPQYQEGAYSEELRRCWNEASLCFSTTTTLQVCRIGILLTTDPTLHYKMTETRAQKQTVFSVDREHRDGCASWVQPVNGGRVWALLTMNGSWQQWQEAKQWQEGTLNFVNNDWRQTWRELLDPTGCAMMTAGESRRFFQDQAVFGHESLASWHSELFDKNQLADVLPQFLCETFLPRLAHESCIKRCTLREWRSVKIHTCCRQWHDSARCTYLHSCLQSPVSIKCSTILPKMITNRIFCVLFV